MCGVIHRILAHGASLVRQGDMLSPMQPLASSSTTSEIVLLNDQAQISEPICIYGEDGGDGDEWIGQSVDEPSASASYAAELQLLRRTRRRWEPK